MMYVSTKTILWLAILTLVITWPQRVDSEVCKKRNDCKCKFENGTIINLKTIGNKEGRVPGFPYTTADEWGVWEFSFNGCHNYADQYCPSGVVACQRSTDHTVTPGFPLGTADTADFTDGTLLRFGAMKDGQQRYTEVRLICDPKIGPGASQLKTLGEINYDWIYHYELTSKCCCPDGCVGGGDDHPDDPEDDEILSFVILCSILSVAVVVAFLALLVGWVIFKKYYRKEKEDIPYNTFSTIQVNKGYF
ncbi:uncharacterized protein [Amphiura filiformis]|uniref:uncharacterized protein n=1 Tax=Amphiura filiformis TaxID=82378 RepID=UPI003B220E32